MTQVSKIDSNITGLRFAIENTDGTLPANPVWYPVEPNQYDKFGGKLKTVARNPINDSRQRKKGVVVDLDATAGFEIDITEDNTQLLMPSFIFAQMRTKAELPVTVIANATDDYQPVSGGAAYFANNLLYAKNFTQTVNNGLKKVASSAANSVVVTTALADETSNGGIISRVGHEFGAGALTVDVSGTLPKIVQSGVAAATQTLTATGNVANGDTVTINGKVYTFQTVLTEADGHVKIGASEAASLLNLKNAINVDGNGVAGTDFAFACVANADVTATATSSTVVLTAVIGGTTGNAVTTVEGSTALSFGGATLTGGTGRSMKEFGLIPGEYICIGDDVGGTSFALSQNNGLKRVKTVTDSAITVDKSTVQMVTDAGTGKTVRVFFGRVLKNEKGTDIHRQTVQFERTLGAPDDASPTLVQAEYVTKCIADQLDLTVKTADKLTAKLGFMAADHETRLGTDGLKQGIRPTIATADAFNATSHVVRLSLAGVDPTTATPVDLFAFLLDLTLTIKNNVKANKAIKYLGAFDHSAGTFEVDAKMTAYFSTVAAIRSVRNNADVTLDMTFAQANKGMTFDLPLVTLDTDGADVKQDEAIQLALNSSAATGAKLDINMNHTLMVVYWDYLPTLAA